MNLSGSPVDFIIAFFGGFLLSLTPCVYPLIPVSIGYIGIEAGGSKIKSLLLGLTYVTGIAITYSILGLIASLTGKIFGQIASSPLSNIFVGILIFVFGLSMFKFFHLTLPNFRKLPSFKKGNYFSVFLLGLASGLVISPCITPVLGSILFFLATKKQILYGMSLLFSFAFGMGLILILAGVFSSFLLSLPRSGKWMEYIGNICAAILLVTGSYFIFTGIWRLL